MLLFSSIIFSCLLPLKFFLVFTAVPSFFLDGFDEVLLESQQLLRDGYGPVLTIIQSQRVNYGSTVCRLYSVQLLFTTFRGPDC